MMTSTGARQISRQRPSGTVSRKAPVPAGAKRVQPGLAPPRVNPPSADSASAGLAGHLWNAIPHELGEKFRPYADRLVRAMLQEIQRAVPEYAQPLQGAFGEVITQSLAESVRACLDSVCARSQPPQQDWAKVFRDLGRVEFAEGRSLDSLQMSYRVGGRVAWRFVSKFGRAHGASPEVLCTAAEAIFAFVDEISALSVDGYSAAQDRAAGTIARRRHRLLELLLAHPPASAQTVASLAEAARWKLPESVTMVALEQRADQHELAIPAVDDQVLVDLEGAEPCLLTADPDRHLEDLKSALQGWRAVIGPHVPLGDAPRSLNWARRTMGLVQRGVLPDAPVTRCSDHLSTLWLLTDEFLMKQLAERSLAPLRNLTVKQRARLAETLLVWLQCRGSAPELAEKLAVHPQTVRYRMHQLEGLFGDRLSDPDERLTMELALRAERFLSRE